MADDKRSTPGEARRRRPAPTIDLTASEVPQAESAAAETADGPSAPTATESSRSSAPKYAAYGGAFVVGIAASLAALWLAGILPPRAPTDNVSPRLAAMEAQIRELAHRPAPQVDSKAVDDKPLSELSQRLAKIEQAVNQPPQADNALTGRIAALETNLKAATSRADQSTAIDALGKRLDTIEQSTKATQDKVTQNATADVAARRTLGAFALRDAVARGAPYAAELSAMKALGAEPSTLAALEPFAAGGILSDAVLVRELRALLPSMIDAANADPARSGGFLERLEANAGRLVRVRPIGEPAGDDPAAVLARIKVKLARNDVAGADSELVNLPQEARALTESWSRKADARKSAIAASRKLVAESAGALGVR